MTTVFLVLKENTVAKDRPILRVVSMPGISGNFMSPHYDDQFEMWYNFEFRTLMLYREQVEEDARYRLIMVPE